MAGNEKVPEDPEEPVLPKEDDREDIEELIRKLVKEHAPEEELPDYSQIYEEIILTNADYQPAELSDLISDEVHEEFLRDAEKYREAEEAMVKYQEEIQEADAAHEKEKFETPEIGDLTEEIPKEAPKKISYRLSDDAKDRLFTGRDNVFKNKIWKLTTEGAVNEEGKVKKINKRIIDSITTTKGYITLVGKKFEPVSPNPTEQELMDKYRGKLESEDLISEIVDRYDLDKIPGSKKGKPPQEKPSPAMSEVILHYIKNLPENMIQYGISRIQDHDPAAFKILAMTFIAAILNGKVIIRDGWKDEIYPNLYTVVIGPPSTQKSSSFSILKGPCVDAIDNLVYNPDWTKEALGVELVDNPAGIVWKDEFAQILDADIREGYMAGVLEFLIMSYDESYYATHRILVERQIEAKGVNFGFIATIQNERFYRLVTEDDVNTGFFNRFCYVILKDRSTPPVQTLYLGEIDETKKLISGAVGELRRRLNHIKKNNPVMMSYTLEAVEVLNKWYAKVDAYCRETGGLTSQSLIAISSRIYTMAKKAALIYETLERISAGEKLTRDIYNTMPTYEISAENIQKGIDFANLCFRNSEYLYLRLRSTDVLVKLRKFEDIIQTPRMGGVVLEGERGKPGAVYGIRRSDLIRATAFKSKDFDEYLKTFIKMDKMWCFRIKLSTTGKKTEIICMGGEPPVGSEILSDEYWKLPQGKLEDYARKIDKQIKLMKKEPR